VAQFAPESLAQFAPDLVAQFDRNIHSSSTIWFYSERKLNNFNIRISKNE
jgi:hypothetical protein